MVVLDSTLRVRSDLRRRVGTVSDSVVRLGEYVTFIVRAIAAVPYTLVHYRKHVVRQIAEMTFGTKTLLSGGGTMGTRV